MACSRREAAAKLVASAKDGATEREAERKTHLDTATQALAAHAAELTALRSEKEQLGRSLAVAEEALQDNISCAEESRIMLTELKSQLAESKTKARASETELLATVSQYTALLEKAEAVAAASVVEVSDARQDLEVQTVESECLRAQVGHAPAVHLFLLSPVRRGLIV